MAKVREIFEKLNELAPVSMKMDFYNVGFLVGEAEHEVTTVLVSLDITDDVVDEAEKLGAQLIVAHHPMFFSLKTVTDEDASGRRIVRLIKGGISAIWMHTNLDAAEGGVNDALAKKAGIVKAELLNVDGYDESGVPYGIGRCGELKETVDFEQYLSYIKDSLNCNGLRYVSAGKKVKRVAVLGGSGGGELALAVKNGCDTFVTADVKYHQFIDAKEAGVNIIDAGHFCTENVVIPELKKYIEANFNNVDVLISDRHKQIEQFV